MKTATTLLFLCLGLVSFSQTNGLKYNRPFVIFEGCDDVENVEQCFKLKSTQFITENLTDSLRQKLIEHRKKDTITLSIRFLFDEEGFIMLNESFIHSSVDSTSKDLKYLLPKFPKVKPTLDEFNRGVASYHVIFYGFTIDSTTNGLIPIQNFEPKEVPFVLLDKVPVFKGCDETLSNEELGNCMNKMMNLYIQKNFRAYLLANDLCLSLGINSIFLFFNINENGTITLTNVRAPHLLLREEGKRLISGLPNAISPGYLNGRAVKTPYFLPVRFVIEDDLPKTKKLKN